MSVQQATFIIRGVRMSYKKFREDNDENALYEQNENLFFSWRDKKEKLPPVRMGILSDGMGDEYVIIGKLIVQTGDRYDGDYFSVIELDENKDDDDKILDFANKFGKFEKSQIKTIVVDHHS